MSDEIQAEGQAATETAAPVSTEPSAAEKRIAELTAQKNEMERQYAARFEEQSKQVAELISAVGRMQTQPVQPAPVEAPPFEIDPDELRKLEYVANKMYAPKFAEMRAQQQAFQQQQMQVAFQQVASTERNAEVTAEAQKLWNHWQQTGKQGFVIADAFTYARGMVLERQQQQRAGETRFGGSDPSAAVVTGHAQPPPVHQAQQQKGLPKNYDSLSFEEQERIFMEVYGNEPL